MLSHGKYVNLKLKMTYISQFSVVITVEKIWCKMCFGAKTLQ